MDEWSPILEAMLIGFASTAGGVFWWHFRKAVWKRELGMLACYFVLVVFLFLMLGPLEWCVSLLPPINDPLHPIYLGIGGGGYGKDYSVYPEAMMLWSLMALAVLMTTDSGHFWARRGRQIGRQNLLDFRPPRKRTVDICNCFLGVATLLALIRLFNNVGWDRLYWSDIGRFDGANGSLGGDDGVRWILPVFLTTGALACLLLFMRGGLFAFAAIWTLSIIPFLVFQSRGITILALLALSALYLRYRRYRMLTLIPFAALLAISAWLPLRLREEQTTGLRVVWDVATNQTQETKKFDGWNMGILLLQNGGQGFGVFCEVLSTIEGGSQQASDMPDGYVLTSLSPMPSSIDGFAQRYAGRDPRINPYTPYSAFSELFVWSKAGFFLVPIFVALVTTALLGRPLDPTKTWILCGLLVALLVLNGWIQASQYAIRTSGRFIYCGWFIGFAEIVFRRVSGSFPFKGRTDS